jgi:predicted nucleotidyltransferase
MEWLHSPITYIQNDDVLKNLRELAKSSFQPLSVCHHYLAMAKKGWESVAEQTEIKIKRYFYVLRALLCCEWIIAENSIPPVEFNAILDRYYGSGMFREATEQLLKTKTIRNESDILLRAQEKGLLDTVDSRIIELFKMIPLNFPKNGDKADKGMFNTVFRSLLAEQQDW